MKVSLIFKKLLKSKKGAIPVFNEILHLTLKIVPTPIWRLLFILLIPLLFTIIIPTILSLLGYTCIDRSGNLELYQVPLSSVLINTYSNFQQGLYNLIGVTAYHLPEDPFPFGDKRYLKIPTECFVNSKANVSNYGYSAGCVNCEADTGQYILSLFFFGFISRKDMVCAGDGYGLNRQQGILPDLVTFCDQCTPPEPYYFNYTNCRNNTHIPNGICYFTLRENVTTSEIDETTFDTTNYYGRVKELNGVKRVQDGKDIINVQCTANNQPELYFFTIEIFNQYMWILLIVGYYLIVFAFVWYHMLRI